MVFVKPRQNCIGPIVADNVLGLMLLIPCEESILPSGPADSYDLGRRGEASCPEVTNDALHRWGEA